MIFLDSVEILSSNRLKKCPFTISDMRDLTVFFGMNGTGKTTILEAMRNRSSSHSEESSNVTKVNFHFTDNLKNGKTLFYSMFQKELFDIKHDFNMYVSAEIGAWDINNSFKSAGERSRNQLDVVKNIENAVFYIDEMDSSLDWKGDIKYYKMLKKMSKTNQIFVASHSVILCAMVGIVYDVGARCWSTFDELKARYKLPRLN